MASEIRVDKINSLSGVGTVTLSPTGVDIAGITTAATLKATTGIVTTLTVTTGIVTTLTTNTLTANSTTKVGSGVTLSPDGDIFATGITTFTGELRLTEGTSSTSNGDEIGSLMYLHPASNNKNAKIVSLMNGGSSGADLAFFTRTQADGTNTDGGEERVRITSSGDVGIGVTNPEAELHVHGNMLVEDTIGNNLTVRSTVNNGNDPNIIFQKARGGGTQAIVQNGDDIGNFQWRGYDGDSYETGASILCEVNGTPADGDMPMRMTLRTRSVGAASEQGRLRLDAAGDVSVMTGNLVISTAGKGIDFSAANNSHYGATASILDDYEEGTWTPAFKAANNSSNATTEVVSARYTKVGRKVSITAYIKLTAHATASTGGIAYVYGLPFTNMNEYSGISVGYWANFAANQDFLGGTVQPSASHLVLRHTTGAASNTTNMDYDNNLQPNSAMIFSATYHTGE